MSHLSSQGVLLITPAPQEALVTALEAKNRCVTAVLTLNEAKFALASGRYGVVVIDASFYHQRPTTVDTLRKSLATPYFIALLSTCFQKLDSKTLSQFLALLKRYLSFTFQITLISKYHFIVFLIF